MSSKKKSLVFEKLDDEKKEYRLISNFVIDTKPEFIDGIVDELTEALIRIVEKSNSDVGGGFIYKEYVDEIPLIEICDWCGLRDLPEEGLVSICKPCALKKSQQACVGYHTGIRACLRLMDSRIRNYEKHKRFDEAMALDLCMAEITEWLGEDTMPSQWMSVVDETPEPGVMVIVVMDVGQEKDAVTCAFMRNNGEWEAANSMPLGTVIAWQPMPKPFV